ncbi:hypothetical protein HDU93_009883 [Gonapodya sp. JEL0774]|nr:hypothetical protein HDU93_009883 [Gonapodya sp. JEL0774]
MSLETWFFYICAAPLGQQANLSVLFNGPPLEVVRAYNPSAQDEIALFVSNVVDVVEVIRDGWGIGRNIHTGAYGLFDCLALDKAATSAAGVDIPPPLAPPPVDYTPPRAESRSEYIASRIMSDQKYEIRTVSVPLVAIASATHDVRGPATSLDLKSLAGSSSSGTIAGNSTELSWKVPLLPSQNLPPEILLAIGEYLPFRLGLPTKSLNRQLVAIFRSPSNIAARALSHHDTAIESLSREVGRSEPAAQKVVRSLLKRTARWNPELINAMSPKTGLYPLTVASMRGNTQIAALLLEMGANSNAGRGQALWRAAEEGHADVVTFLLQRGAGMDLANDWPLRVAAISGHQETMRVLLDRGAHPSGHALEWASSNGRVDMVRMLLSYGANPNYEGARPLWAAVRSGKLDVVKLLLQGGADACSEDNGALAVAETSGRLEIVSIIQSYADSIPLDVTKRHCI